MKLLVVNFILFNHWLIHLLNFLKFLFNRDLFLFLLNLYLYLCLLLFSFLLLLILLNLDFPKDSEDLLFVLFPFLLKFDEKLFFFLRNFYFFVNWNPSLFQLLLQIFFQPFPLFIKLVSHFHYLWMLFVIHTTVFYDLLYVFLNILQINIIALLKFFSYCWQVDRLLNYFQVICTFGSVYRVLK